MPTTLPTVAIPTVRVTCRCKTCKANAEKVGAAFPLAATVDPAMLEMCKGRAHGIVYSAHDPSAVGHATRLRTSIRPA